MNFSIIRRTEEESELSKLKQIIPVRIKIVALLGVSVLLSLAIILTVVKSIFIEDKNAYILDYNLTLVRSAANSVDSQISRSMLLMRLLHNQLRSHDRAGVDQLFKESAGDVGMKSLVVLRLSPAGYFAFDFALGDSDGKAVKQLDELGWDTMAFQGGKALVGKTSTGELAVGTLVKFPEGGGMAYVGLLRPELNLGKETAGDFQIYVVDSSGSPLYSKETGKGTVSRAELVKILKSVFEDHVSSGAKTANDWLIGYQRLQFQEFTVIGMIPEAVAFSAVNGLIKRTLWLGLSIMMMATAFALIFARQLTEGLRQMVLVTEKVSQGSFNFRVDTRSMGNDEIGALASSFNAMAEKIDVLMVEAVNRVETKHQEETVAAVQTNLLPDRPLSLSNVNISGKSESASQCGGDWWFYDQVGEYIILIMGQVEDTGLPAALLTAAAHGAATSFVSTSKMISKRAPILKLLVNHLNTAIAQAGRGQATMKCFISIFDTFSGQMHVVNAGNPVPLMHRLGFGGRPEFDNERYFPVVQAEHPALGASLEFAVTIETIQLKQSDALLFYTPGLEKVYNKDQIYTRFAELFDKYGPLSAKLCGAFLDGAVARLGKWARRI